MVAVNPGIPKEELTGREVFLSKANETPRFESTSAIQLREIGQGVEGAIKGADNIVTAWAKSSARQAVEPEMEDYTQTLEKARYASTLAPDPANQERVRTTGVDANSPAGPMDITTQQGMPADINSLSARVSALHGARAINGGPLSETAYYGRLAALTSDVRANFPPAYSDVIDSEVHRITGVIPANAYIQSLTKDISNMMSSNEKVFDETRHELQQLQGRPGGREALINFLNTKQLGPAIDFVSKWKAHDFETQDLEATARGLGAQQTLERYQYGNKFGTWANSLKDTIVQGSLTAVGMDPLTGTLQALQKFQSGKMSPEEKTQFSANAGNLDLTVTGWENYFNKEFDAKLDSEAPNSGGRTWRQVLGPRADELRKEHTQLFAQLHNDLTTGKTAAAVYSLHQSEALTQAAKLGLMQRSDIGGFAQLYQSAKDLFGESVAQSMATDASSRANPVIAQWMTSTLKIPAMVEDPTNGGKIKDVATTPAEAITKINKAYDILGISPEERRGHAISTSFFDMVDSKTQHSLSNPETPIEVKRNLANYFFKPENQSWLNMIVPDKKDPETGQTIEGREALYYRLGSKEIAKQMFEIGGQPYENYKYFMHTQADKVIFPQAIAKFRDLAPEGEGYSIAFKPGDPPSFVRVDKAPTRELDVPYNVRPLRASIDATLGGINKVIRAQYNIGKVTGDTADEINSRILTNLMGENPDKFANVPGIPEQMRKSLMADIVKKKLDEARQKGVEPGWNPNSPR